MRFNSAQLIFKCQILRNRSPRAVPLFAVVSSLLGLRDMQFLGATWLRSLCCPPRWGSYTELLNRRRRYQLNSDTARFARLPNSYLQPIRLQLSVWLSSLSQNGAEVHSIYLIYPCEASSSRSHWNPFFLKGGFRQSFNTICITSNLRSANAIRRLLEWVLQSRRGTEILSRSNTDIDHRERYFVQVYPGFRGQRIESFRRAERYNSIADVATTTFSDLSSWIP